MHCTVLYCTVLYYALYCTLYCTVLCTVHCTILCYALYNIVHFAGQCIELQRKSAAAAVPKVGTVIKQFCTVLYSTVLYCTVMLYCTALAKICLDIFVLSVLNHCSAKLNFSFKAARMCDLGLPRSQNADYTVQYSTVQYI